LKIDNHTICPELYDYASLMVNIFTTEEVIQDKHHTIIKNSEEEKEFTSELIEAVRNINTLHILDKKSLKLVVQEYARISDLIWYKHLKYITKQSKAW